MDELFTVQTVLSPRLRWIAEYEVHVERNDHTSPEWSAWSGNRSEAGEAGLIASGSSEEEAIVELAKLCGWKLWNEA